MNCPRCGLIRHRRDVTAPCIDCQQFSDVVKTVFDEVDRIFKGARSLDPSVHPLLQLLADMSFITTTNPHTAIYYKLCSLIVEAATLNKMTISERELNRQIRTTRGWGPTFKVFEEVGFVEVEHGEYERIIKLTKQATKLAKSYFSEEPLSEQLVKRVSHIYAGYLLLHILSKLATLEKSDDKGLLPYNIRPRTLWVILMFLWMKAYQGKRTFNEGDFQRFVGRRGIPSSSIGKLIWALQMMDGRVVHRMVKTISFEKGERRFTFEDNVLEQMERIRRIIRTRDREVRR